MLQFLANVQLPNCPYVIPQLKTKLRYGDNRYLICNKQVWGEHSIEKIITPFRSCPLTIPIALTIHHTNGYPYLYVLTETGEEYTYPRGLTGRGPECYSEYLL